jgi:hypothetical protein
VSASAGAPGVRPRHAAAGRTETFRALVTGRTAMYALVLGGAAALVYGAYRGRPATILWGLAIVAAMVVSVCAFMADRPAERRFFSAFATSLGLDYVARWDLLPFTPLLGAGDRRWCEHWMTGEIVPGLGLSGGLGHFVWQRRSRLSERESGLELSQEVTHEHHRFTLATVEVDAALPLFHGVFVHRRRGLVDHFSDWLDRPPHHEIEVESAAFGERYELRLADEQDELRARQLLAPSLVDWLANHPLAPELELRAGTLVVFTRRVLEDAGNLAFFLEGVRELAGRVLREVGEAAATADAAPRTRRASTPPPTRA